MGRNLHNLLLPLLAFCYMAPIHARFTKTTCWIGLNTACIQQNAAGAWCFIPNAAEGQPATCTGNNKFANADFATVLEVHLAQGLSVAYYNGIDNSLLGGADYDIPSNPGVIRLCASGQAGDGSDLTICVNALADNTFGGPNCQVLLGQKNVTDGCYSPNVVAHSPSSTISSSGSVSTSSPGSTNSGPSYTPAQANSAQSLNSMLHSVLLPVILVSSRIRVFGLLMSLAVASSWLPSTHARFTQATCWNDQCIQQNSVGTWCYIPNSAPLQTSACTSTNPVNAGVASVMEVHLSIAFYNGVDNGFLGGANFSGPANPGIMRRRGTGS